ncbi:MAG: MerR family transcriptional regulator [Chloroflexi bacterium]|nr:MerR family transcriptional regulator [Chloroflexota bacterium]
MSFSEFEPVFTISIVARRVRLHPQTIRAYERAGLIEPHRTDSNIRLYSGRDVERLLQIKTWIDDLGLNLAGVEIMTRLSDRVAELEGRVNELTMEVVRWRAATARRSLPEPDPRTAPG